MKKNLTLFLLIMSFMGWGQDGYLKKVLIDNELWDTLTPYREIDYDYDWQVSEMRQYNNLGELTIRYHFEHDTLKQIDSTGTPYYLAHGNDTIYIHDGMDTLYCYRTIEDYQIKRSCDPMYFMYWHDNNLSALDIDGNMVEGYLYSDLLNPYFNAFKTYRLNHESSFNYFNELIYDHGDYKTNHIIVKHGNYPAEVEHLYNGEYAATYYFRYEVVDVIDETPATAEVISISYFDLMGRKKAKPKTGFYIERRVTDKGIISTKHYIQ